MGSVLGELCQKVRGHGVGTGGAVSEGEGSWGEVRGHGVGTGGAVSEGEGSWGRYWGSCVRS